MRGVTGQGSVAPRNRLRSSSRGQFSKSPEKVKKGKEGQQIITQKIHRRTREVKSTSSSVYFSFAPLKHPPVLRDQDYSLGVGSI